MIASVETRVRMHLNDIGLPQVIVSSNYDVSSRKIFSHLSMQFLDELSPLGIDDIFKPIGFVHVSHSDIIINRLTMVNDDYVTIYVLTPLSESVFLFSSMIRTSKLVYRSL